MSIINAIPQIKSIDTSEFAKITDLSDCMKKSEVLQLSSEPNSTTIGYAGQMAIVNTDTVYVCAGAITDGTTTQYVWKKNRSGTVAGDNGSDPLVFTTSKTIDLSAYGLETGDSITIACVSGGNGGQAGGGNALRDEVGGNGGAGGCGGKSTGNSHSGGGGGSGVGYGAGGGGGGGRHYYSSTSGATKYKAGNGGAGGAGGKCEVKTVTLTSTSVAVTIGAGGTGGSGIASSSGTTSADYTIGNVGGTGGTTSFGSYLSVTGGGGKAGGNGSSGDYRSPSTYDDYSYGGYGGGGGGGWYWTTGVIGSLNQYGAGSNGPDTSSAWETYGGRGGGAAAANGGTGGNSGTDSGSGGAVFIWY